jgi:hypothetical protein
MSLVCQVFWRFSRSDQQRQEQLLVLEDAWVAPTFSPGKSTWLDVTGDLAEGV